MQSQFIIGLGDDIKKSKFTSCFVSLWNQPSRPGALVHILQCCTACNIWSGNQRDPNWPTSYFGRSHQVWLINLFDLNTCSMRKVDDGGKTRKITARKNITSWDWAVPSSAQANFKLILLTMKRKFRELPQYLKFGGNYHIDSCKLVRQNSWSTFIE